MTPQLLVRGLGVEPSWHLTKHGSPLLVMMTTCRWLTKLISDESRNARGCFYGR
jgi:hypothetical protein